MDKLETLTNKADAAFEAAQFALSIELYSSAMMLLPATRAGRIEEARIDRRIESARSSIEFLRVVRA